MSMENKKLSTYITLIIGIAVAFYVFFLDRTGAFERINSPYYSYLVQRFFDSKIGIDEDIAEVLWWPLLILFLWSWWSLRNCISSIISRFHTKV